MAHATLDVQVTGIPEMVALLRAAADVIDLAVPVVTQNAGEHLIGAHEYQALRSAVRVFIPEPDDPTPGGSD